MTVYAILPVIEIVFCIALLALLTFAGKRHVARRQFALFLGFMALWGVFVFLMRVSSDLSVALIWEKFILGAILTAAFAFYHFTLSFTSRKSPKGVMVALTLLFAGVLLLMPTDLIAHGMRLLWYGKAPAIGPLFPVYLVAVYSPLAFALALLIKHCRASRIADDITRDQYVIAGIIALLIGGTSDYLPSLGLAIYPLGIIGNILFCILTTIAMLRYGLLEMRVVLRKGATYSLTSILVFGVFGSLILGLSRLFEATNPLSMTITITVVFIVAAVFQPALSRLQQWVDKLFFRERYEHLQALKQFTEDRETDLNLDQLSTSLVTSAANGMISRGVYLLLPNPATGSYETRASCGEAEVRPLSFAANSSLVVTMRYQNRIVDVTEVDVIPSLTGFSDDDLLSLMQNHIELFVPIRAGERLVGILLVANKISKESYSNEERQLLKSAANMVATKIENASRYEGLQKERSELQQTMEGLIHAVSAMVEFRDPYTAGHQRRVAQLAAAIAREMGLSPWQVKGVYITGLLHDVGKIIVPAEILSKPGKISEHEFSIIKNHPRVGFEILQKMDFPWPAAKAILQHHERLNGSGYPYGLLDDAIVLEAKILGVADAVEAMSSHRPYRPALGLSVALKEISQQKGVLYDSRVVDACLRLLKGGDAEFDRLMTEAEKPDLALAALK